MSQSIRADDSSEALRLGAIFNLTGSQAVLDQPSWKGAQLAERELNAQGGALGRRIKLCLVDGKSSPELVAERTLSLIADQPSVVALFGLSDSDLARVAGLASARKGRLFLTSGATSPQLPTEVPTYLYLACFGDNVQAAAAAEWAYKRLKARNAAIVYNREFTYSRLLQKYFRSRFEALGGTAIAVDGYREDASAALTDKALSADLIFLASEATDDAIKGVQAIRKAGISAPILGGDGYDTPALWAQHPELTGVYYTTHAFLSPESPDPVVASFRHAYVDAFPGEEPDGFAALGYDTVRLLVDAVKRAGTDDPGKVLDAIGRTRGFRGVTGTITYNESNRVPQKTVSLVGVSHGKTALVEQVLPSEVPRP